MLRTFAFSMQGVDVRLTEMSWTQVEKHVQEGQELLKRGESDTPPTPNEWFQRIVAAVETSLAAAGGEKNTLQYLKDNYGLSTLKNVIPAMYERIMDESGLRSSEPGEVEAAPTLPNSEAA